MVSLKNSVSVLKRAGGFEPGVSGNPLGRPKGLPNRVTQDGRKYALRLITSAKYRAKLREQLEAGILAPQLQQMLWSYAFGKPKETIEWQGDALITLQQLLVEVVNANSASEREAIEVEVEPINGNGHDNGSE